ncbi:c-type cytochrome [Nostoc sp. 'Lobaria pulmonaria (5183) cyanobiont']|uniref:c-type cytochrome n=1 Tax=Nostoc sp. 'Lobaria pulmonaria (5183) cyanobiont' TaxID=1618022 RepID=UPI000CF35F70|nr:c-type cytochrome [Nostoc sp. 'Lobaria pulmonaria (5183) cyanobiont']AVH73708.1 cytochrome c domain-containing protein [Nostoc sp. 'Lobaria pulmonaria (5183) cyanobiont']
MTEQTNPTLLPTSIKGVFQRIWVVIVGIGAVAVFFLWPVLSNSPVDYADIENHFKYGSIGSEPVNGIPYWIWKVLPELFPDKLPGKGYTSLGFIKESDKDLPIGFSQRQVFIDRVGLNCAVCHTGTLRNTPNSEHQVITTMPANVVNLQGYIKFLSAVGVDERFTANRMLPEIEKISGGLNPIEKLLYRFIAIPQTRDALINQASRLDFVAQQPDWGPGRVDTFNPYKAIQFHFPMDKLREDELIGTSDFPSIWNQKPREGLQLHWDGNNTSVNERNKSAALGAGVTPTTIDLPRIQRVADWLWELPPPKYPYEVNEAIAAKGEQLFESNCASCHAFGGAYTGKVVPIQEIGTDPHRLDSYTYETMSNQNTLYAGYPWRFKNFRKTNGYANMPLDGVWLRGPYLHNGSVPTLRDLLEKPENRPKEFYRGYDVIDRAKVGFVSDVGVENGKQYFKFDTTKSGNSNSGHLYGVDLPTEDKDALVEYMKKL